MNADKKRGQIRAAAGILGVIILVIIAWIGYTNRSQPIAVPDTNPRSQHSTEPKPALVNADNDGTRPILAWVGQRVVLEEAWRDGFGNCPWADPGSSFLVSYRQTAGPGRIFNGLGGEVTKDSERSITVQVLVDPVELVANSDCTSRVLFDSQEWGEVNVTASLNARGVTRDFVIYYMGFEDSTCTLGQESLAEDPADGELCEALGNSRVNGWVAAD